MPARETTKDLAHLEAMVSNNGSRSSAMTLGPLLEEESAREVPKMPTARTARPRPLAESASDCPRFSPDPLRGTDRYQLAHPYFVRL